MRITARMWVLSRVLGPPIAVCLLSLGAVGNCGSESEFGRELEGEVSLANPQYTPHWSKDGTIIVFGHGNGIRLIDSEGSFIRTIPENDQSNGWAATDYSPAISPDGAKVVYTTLRYESGFGWGECGVSS